MSPEALERLRAWEFDGQDADDLRALLDAYDTARAEGEAAERARVVAWLRRTDGTAEEGWNHYFADAIWRGDHDKEGM